MKRRTKTAKYSVIFLFGIIILFLVLFGGYSIIFAQKIYLNQTIDKVNFGGKTKEEAKKLLTENTKTFLDTNIELKYSADSEEAKNYSIKPVDLGIQYDLDATLNNMWKYGRSNNILLSFWQQLKSIFKNSDHSAIYTINEDSLNKKISEIGEETDIPEKDFSLLYQNGSFALTSERNEGRRIDQEYIRSQIKSEISEIKSRRIDFSAKSYKPRIDERKAKERLKEANDLLDDGQLTLQFDGQKHVADVSTIASFISSRTKDDDLEIIFNEDNIKTFVSNLASAINVAPQNATLTVRDGKAAVFTTATMGKTLDNVQTVVDIENSLSSRLPGRGGTANPTAIDLKVDIKKPEITDDAINNLGIVELVGIGTTDFKTSPANRVHNITVGMTSINGTLVKPGEEFSTLNKLGTIDASTGYLPELVIKNNQTIPDYGGGLCQVSTTLFRAAMNAGLKITERTNHSYRVSYYEPPVGMDATIFDPAPDFKFVNNFDKHLLIQGHITGTKITFEIYGTKDNRVSTISDPEVYDYVEPPTAETIPSDTLPTGERQQVQKPHQGATAKFHYRVERNGEILQEKNFISKYIALPEKWLVGTASTPPPAPETTPPAPAADPAPAPAPAVSEPTPTPESELTPTPAPTP